MPVIDHVQTRLYPGASRTPEIASVDVDAETIARPVRARSSLPALPIPAAAAIPASAPASGSAPLRLPAPASVPAPLAHPRLVRRTWPPPVRARDREFEDEPTTRL